MLGTALCEYLLNNSMDHIGFDRHTVDFSNFQKLEDILDEQEFSLLINCAAIIDINFCDTSPNQTYLINTLLPKQLAIYCRKRNEKFLHISTDHFYSDGTAIAHSETDAVELTNNYAAQKWHAEKYVLENNQNSLILRTSLLGYNRRQNSLIDWVLKTFRNSDEIMGFTDSFTSSIDVKTFCELLFGGDLIQQGGIFNLANATVYSKYTLICEIKSYLSVPIKVIPSSIKRLDVNRANSCGLSIYKVSDYIPFRPTLEKSLQNLNLKERLYEI